MSTSKMLIDASHPEETRVVVLKGHRVEEFDFESANKKQLRGNIYLAKVTRVEPSLQAAFVDYGGNRHGFLAFSEIHPHYYQIPFADQQLLLEEEARVQRDEDDEGRNGGGNGGHRRTRRHKREGNVSALDRRGPQDEAVSEPAPVAAGERTSAQESVQDLGEIDLDHPPEGDVAQSSDVGVAAPAAEEGTPSVAATLGILEDADDASVPSPLAGQESDEGSLASRRAEGIEAAGHEFVAGDPEAPPADEPAQPLSDLHGAIAPDDLTSEGTIAVEGGSGARGFESGSDTEESEAEEAEQDEEAVEQIGGDALEETSHRPSRPRRHYKIQEVIKRRQILLVQVVKEERGNKGAALTTYLSLAGRYSVLMPNTARGGGISRKITDMDDRRRLKSIAQELEVPEGMGVILRTAGAARSKVEVKRDFEYLLRMWESVRELTLKSTAPTLIYEEGSLIKRSIRDLYTNEVEDVIVAGEEGYREAKDFMRMLMPSAEGSVQLYREMTPIFAKSGVEAQLDAMFSNHVTLKSGGYLVINQTEALVAIDVNSGRSTREHNIEDTALRTNLEAADEVARQLRLRDLAGLIVVDFIDMDEGRNNRAVERRIKEALKNDRARIQIGRISHFGLLEMSRQRIRTGVLEGSTVVCSHCAGTGTVRSTASIALHVLRLLEDVLIKDGTHNLIVRSRPEVALYILNQKRQSLIGIEGRFGVSVSVIADPMLTGMVYHAIERGELATPVLPLQPAADLIRVDSVAPRHDNEADAVLDDDGDGEDAADDTEDEDEGHAKERSERDASSGETAGDGSRKRKRRRRRRGRDRDVRGEIAPGGPQPSDDGLAEMARIGGDLTPEAMSGRFDPQVDDAVTLDLLAEEASGAADRTGATLEGSPGPDIASSEEVTSSSELPPDQGGDLPRRRRSRRATPKAGEIPPAVAGAARIADDSDDERVTEATTPSPRRARRPSRARTPEHSVEEAEIVPVGDAPSAAGGAGGWEDSAPPPAEATSPQPSTEYSATAPDAAATATITAMEAEATPLETAVFAEAEPPRPKRSGWWQRAKATFGN